MNCPKCNYPDMDGKHAKGTYSPDSRCDGCGFIETNHRILGAYKGLRQNIEARRLLEQELERLVAHVHGSPKKSASPSRKDKDYSELTKQLIELFTKHEKEKEPSDISKSDLQTLYNIAKNGDNSGRDFDDCTSLKRRLVEAKVLVDRWQNITHAFVLNPAHKDFADKQLWNDSSYNETSIWGADIIYSEYMPTDEILAIGVSMSDLDKILDPIMDSRDPLFDSSLDGGRSVAVVPMPSKLPNES